MSCVIIICMHLWHQFSKIFHASCTIDHSTEYFSVKFNNQITTMSTSPTFQHLTLFIKELMTREGIEEYELHIQGDSEKGGNYMSDVTFFSVVPKGKGKTYNLVVKSSKRSENAENTMPVVEAFIRESFMYRVVFSEMRTFLISAGDHVHLDYVPKMYSVCDEIRKETLILENLSPLGYRLWDKKKAMDINHVILVLEALAKHHAICSAMRKKLPKVFEDITENLTNLSISFFKTEEQRPFFKPLIEKACEVLRKSNRNDLAKKVSEKIKENITAMMFSDTPLEDKLVICHGDCWNNNILFKYKDSDHADPSGLCLVDFQLSMLDSPVKDLSFFLYTACDKSLLDNFQFLLQRYYDSFSATLEALGCDSGDIFTYKQLMDHWKKYGAFGLVLCAFFLRIEQLGKDEVPDVDAGDDFQNIFTSEIKNEEIYNSRIRDVFIHFGEMFL